MNDVLTMPPNTLAGRGIGDNRPPLAEVPRRRACRRQTRAHELLESALNARIENAADAGKVADLIVFLRDTEQSLDRARDARKKPLLRDQRIIETAYGALIGPLARARLDILAPMHAAWVKEHPGEQSFASVAAVGSRREISFVIEDLPMLLDWLLKHHGGAVGQAARTILGGELRHAGVDAIERGNVKIPGVSISIVSKTQVR
jgi:hypothetical protein